MEGLICSNCKAYGLLIKFFGQDCIYIVVLFAINCWSGAYEMWGTNASLRARSEESLIVPMLTLRERERERERESCIQIRTHKSERTRFWQF